MQRWIAVWSTYAAQLRVSKGLPARGVETYTPMEAFWAGRNHRGDREWDSRPLFTNYTFAKCLPERLGDILSMKGVVDVVRAESGKPSFVADELIDTIRRAEAAHIFDRTQDYGFPGGTGVRITEGPFAGFIGKIKSASPKHRPVLLLKMLGAMTETSVPIDKLEKVDA